MRIAVIPARVNSKLKLQESHLELFNPNQHIIRNEGGTMGTGQKLWKRAKEIIPGGNMLLLFP